MSERYHADEIPRPDDLEWRLRLEDEREARREMCKPDPDGGCGCRHDLMWSEDLRGWSCRNCGDFFSLRWFKANERRLEQEWKARVAMDRPEPVYRNPLPPLPPREPPLCGREQPGCFSTLLVMAAFALLLGFLLASC